MTVGVYEYEVPFQILQIAGFHALKYFVQSVRFSIIMSGAGGNRTTSRLLNLIPDYSNFSCPLIPFPKCSQIACNLHKSTFVWRDQSMTQTRLNDWLFPNSLGFRFSFTSCVVTTSISRYLITFEKHSLLCKSSIATIDFLPSHLHE
jgi:hypothetical protein